MTPIATVIHRVVQHVMSQLHLQYSSLGNTYLCVTSPDPLLRGFRLVLRNDTPDLEDVIAEKLREFIARQQAVE
jgi:hypothetical protein